MPELRPNANVPPEHLLNTLQSLEAAVDESTRGAQNKIYDQTAGSVASTRLVSCRPPAARAALPQKGRGLSGASYGLSNRHASFFVTPPPRRCDGSCACPPDPWPCQNR